MQSGLFDGVHFAVRVGRRVSIKKAADPAVLVAACLMLAVAVGLVFVGIASGSLRAVLIGMVAGAGAMTLLPNVALPSISLWLLVLVPFGYISITAGVGRYLSLAVVAVGIWLLRIVLAEDRDFFRFALRGWLVIAPVLLMLLVSTMCSEYGRTSVMITWSAVFVICVVAPALVGQVATDDVWPKVQVTFACVGMFLGVLALSEYLLQFNPWRYFLSSDVASKTWSVFRARTSLGHPLTTSMVASVALAVCLFPGVSRSRWLFRAGAVGALVALVLSVSRGGVVAVAAAAVVGLLSSQPKDQGSEPGKIGSRRGWTFLLVAAVTAMAVLSPLLSQRRVSGEGLVSVSMRSQIFSNSWLLVMERPVTGFGPGISSLIYEQRYGEFSIENSALQLMVSIGIPAFLLVSVGLTIVVRTAMRRSRAGVAAGLVAFLVSVAGYNALDSNPALLAVLAPLVYCAVSPARFPAPAREQAAVLTPGSPEAPSPFPVAKLRPTAISLA
jgi:hypothetical protein